MDKTDKSLNVLKDQQRQFLRESQARAESLQSQSLVISAVITCLLALAGFGAAFVLRAVTRQMRASIGELSEGAGQVASAAAQVASASQSLAQGASEQAASIEETSASTEQITAMASRNRDHSGDAAEMMIHWQTKFQETNNLLDQSVAAMGEISTQSERISRILKTIDEIAFQTNILALNAAVEAARAGDAGMGFAVVAGEVRSLAGRCAQAARDTAGLVEESITKSRAGQIKVDEVAAAIRVITEEATRVKVLVDNVNVGSQQQVHGVKEIGRAMTQMEQVTQNTAAGAEESAAAAEELGAQSEGLKQVVEQLTAMVGANSRE